MILLIVPSDSSYKFKGYNSPSSPLWNVKNSVSFSFFLYVISFIPISIAARNSNNFSFSLSIILGRMASRKFVFSQSSDVKTKISIIPEYTVLKISVFKLSLLKKDNTSVSDGICSL